MQLIARVVPLLVGVLTLAVLIGSVALPQDPAPKPLRQPVARCGAASEIVDCAADMEGAERNGGGSNSELESRLMWSGRFAKVAGAVGEKRGDSAPIERLEKLLAMTRSLTWLVGETIQMSRCVAAISRTLTCSPSNRRISRW